MPQKQEIKSFLINTLPAESNCLQDMLPFILQIHSKSRAVILASGFFLSYYALWVFAFPLLYFVHLYLYIYYKIYTLQSVSRRTITSAVAALF